MNGRTTNQRCQTAEFPDVMDRMALESRIPVRECPSLREPVQGQWINTALSNVFFSSNNINILQNALRRGVYTMSNGRYLISPQDCGTLQTIMRSIFLQYSRNLSTNIREQVDQLNKKVLNYCIPQVYSSMRGYLTYLDSIDKIPTPIALPTYTDHLNKSLELRTPGF